MSSLIRSALALTVLLGTQFARADIAFHYNNGEITDMIQAYSKASGKQFIVDPGVRGRASVFNNGDVSLDEAYNILAEVLAINGYAMIEQGNTRIVKSARNAQRDGIPTLTKLPPPRPNMMVTMIFRPKYISVEELNKRLRILPSKDGEMTPFEPAHQLIVSDFATNVNRIAGIIDALDTPENAKWKDPNPNPKPQMKKGEPKMQGAPPAPAIEGTKPSKHSASNGASSADQLDQLFED